MIEHIKKTSLDDNLIELSVKILKNNGVIAFPTDTVYGIGALPKNKTAVEKLYKIKKRSSNKPIPILISSKDLLKKISLKVPPYVKKLIKKYWPGALTLILPKSKIIPSYVTKGSKNVAVRMPNNKTALSLIKAAGGMLAVTSANISGNKAATSANEIRKLKGIDLVIDEGRTKIGEASTIVAFFKNKPLVLRKGSVKL